MMTTDTEQQQQQRSNRRVGLVLTLLAVAVFVTTIIRQWVSGPN